MVYISDQPRDETNTCDFHLGFHLVLKFSHATNLVIFFIANRTFELLVSFGKKNSSFLLLVGYYMHIETSFPRSRGDKARLISPVYTPVRGGQCFQFWYHMYGSDIDTLNVYIKTGSNISIPVWSRSGNRGDLWKISQVPVTDRKSVV